MAVDHRPPPEAGKEASWTPTPPPHHAAHPGFHVGYEVKPCAYGLGLFATHFIPAGTLIWKYRGGRKGEPGANVLVFQGEAEVRARLEELPPEERRCWVQHVYVYDGKLNDILDDARLWNHSEDPNTGSGPAGADYDPESSYALRDIEAGEELLDDYGTYEYPEWFYRLLEEYQVSMDYVQIKPAPSQSHVARWVPTPPPHHDVHAGFHVGYEVKEGRYGKGLYATHLIPAGTLIWKYVGGSQGEPGINVVTYRDEAETRARLEQIKPEERRFWVEHVYMYDGKLNEILDDGLLWNHSEDPNTGLPPPGDEYCWESSYSIRDIQPGEELLDDYGLYDYPEWYNRLLEEYNVPRDFVSIKPSPSRMASQSTVLPSREASVADVALGESTRTVA